MSVPPARGSKPYKTVWVCYSSIPHANGYTERYVSGVYATRDAAVAGVRAWLDPHHGEPRVTLDEDAAYLQWPSHNTVRINRFPVQV